MVCESTAAEAVDDMQRMNGTRPTDGGRPKADHNTEGRQSGQQEAAEGPTQETHRHASTARSRWTLCVGRSREEHRKVWLGGGNTK